MAWHQDPVQGWSDITTTRPMLTVKAAVESCQVSEKTIRRHLPALAEHGAVRDDDGAWRIPVEALQAVGLRPGKPKGPDRRDRDQDDRRSDLRTTAHARRNPLGSQN